jgi:transposase-like protein
VPEFEKCWQAYERPVGDSWRVDESYLKVAGQWVYLYRAVDKQGKTVESYLSRTRDVTAAKAFFRKALKPGQPRLAVCRAKRTCKGVSNQTGQTPTGSSRIGHDVRLDVHG